MKSSLWNSLEILSTQAALLVEWKKELGEDFLAARAFLRATQQQAGTYPCTHPNTCACRHRVIYNGEEDVSAACECDQAGCEPILLNASDLIVYALNRKAIAVAIRKAFGFNEIEWPGLEEIRSYLVGSWGLRMSPVFFNVPISENGLFKEIDRLCAAISKPFVLLTPSSRFCTAFVLQALQRHGSMQMALGNILRLTAPGVLGLVPGAKAGVEAFLSDFGKQAAQGKPLELAIARVEAKLDAIAKSRDQRSIDNEGLSEGVAQQALALIKKLDNGNQRKTPSLLALFRLYCIKERSAAQIAKQFGCSKSAIIQRLKLLAQKTGMPSERLRQHSAQFERMEEQLGDSRAKRIHRQALVDDEPDDDRELI